MLLPRKLAVQRQLDAQQLRLRADDVIGALPGLRPLVEQVADVVAPQPQQLAPVHGLRLRQPPPAHQQALAQAVVKRRFQLQQLAAHSHVFDGPDQRLEARVHLLGLLPLQSQVAGQAVFLGDVGGDQLVIRHAAAVQRAPAEAEHAPARQAHHRRGAARDIRVPHRRPEHVGVVQRPARDHAAQPLHTAVDQPRQPRGQRVAQPRGQPVEGLLQRHGRQARALEASQLHLLQRCEERHQRQKQDEPRRRGQGPVEPIRAQIHHGLEQKQKRHRPQRLDGSAPGAPAQLAVADDVVCHHDQYDVDPEGHQRPGHLR